MGEKNEDYRNSLREEIKSNKAFKNLLDSPKRQVRALAYKVFRKKYLFDKKMGNRKLALIGTVLVLWGGAFAVGASTHVPALYTGWAATLLVGGIAANLDKESNREIAKYKSALKKAQKLNSSNFPPSL